LARYLRQRTCGAPPQSQSTGREDNRST